VFRPQRAGVGHPLIEAGECASHALLFRLLIDGHPEWRNTCGVVRRPTTTSHTPAASRVVSIALQDCLIILSAVENVDDRDLLCVDIEGCHYPLVLSLRLMLQECLTPLLGAGAGTLTAVAISLQPHNLACPASQTSPKLKNISRAPDAPIDRSLRYDRRFVAYSITEYSNALCRLFHRFRVRLRCFCVCEMLPTTAWRHQYGAEKPDSA